MGFAILRTQKLKHTASIRRSLTHAFREQDTPNADPERAGQNSHIGANSVADGMAKVAALLPENRRKDAVLAIEYLVTASPEDMAGKTRQQQDAYFADALTWLRERHGNQNVVYAGIHRDEHTPHLYAYAVPVDAATGRLNAKKWLGGAKALTEMQTEFAQRVGKAHGLERGIEGSKAHHKTIQQHYRDLNRTVATPVIDIPAPGMADRINPQAYGERVAESVQAQLKPSLDAITARAKEREAEAKRRKEVEATAQRQARKLSQLEPVAKLFDGLTADQVQAVAAEANKHKAANRIAAEAKRRAEQLVVLVRTTAGAVLTFAQRGVEAIKAKAGDWRAVDWPTVEKAAIREAVHEHHQPKAEAVRAVLTHSPGQAGTPQEMAAALLERAAADDRAAGLRPEPTPKPERDGPSLGR